MLLVELDVNKCTFSLPKGQCSSHQSSLQMSPAFFYFYMYNFMQISFELVISSQFFLKLNFCQLISG